MREPLVELDDVHHRVEQVDVLRGVTLAVGHGEFVVVTGAPGSGKSTLLQVMGGLERPCRGEVRLEGRPVSLTLDDELALYRRRRIGSVFGYFHLLPTLSAADNVALPLLLDGCEPQLARDIARRRLASLGLADRADRRPRDLPDGTQQLVAIARALVTEPPLLLADEPAAELDEASGAEVYGVLSELGRRFGTAVVLVTHDEGVREIGDRAMRLGDGALTEMEHGRKSA